MSTPHLVILGAGYAGLTAAVRLASRARRGHIRVTLVTERAEFVERIRLHQRAAGQDVGLVPLERLRALHGIDVVIGRVERIDLASHTVLVAGTDPVAYDLLGIATGSEAARDVVRGARAHAAFVGDRAGADDLRTRFRALPPRSRVMVVGGGLTGIETATELAEARPELSVTLVTRQSPGAEFVPHVHGRVTAALKRLGIVVRLAKVDAVESDGILAADGDRVPADLVVWAAGFTPSALGRGLGVAHDRLGRLVVDTWMRSVDRPELFAAGDVAGPVGGVAPSRMSCQTAIPMGTRMAESMWVAATGRRRRPVFPLRYVWTNISLGRGDAVTQFTDAQDRPNRWSLRGGIAARFKEAISRGARRTAVGGRVSRARGV